MGGGFIETAISLALIYLMLSPLCTTIVELGASVLGFRSKCFERTLRSILYVDPAKLESLTAVLAKKASEAENENLEKSVDRSGSKGDLFAR